MKLEDKFIRLSIIMMVIFTLDTFNLVICVYCVILLHDNITRSMVLLFFITGALVILRGVGLLIVYVKCCSMLKDYVEASSYIRLAIIELFGFIVSGIALRLIEYIV